MGNNYYTNGEEDRTKYNNRGEGVASKIYKESCSGKNYFKKIIEKSSLLTTQIINPQTIVEYMEKIMNELQKVESPFVLNNYSISIEEEGLCISTEYIEGLNLKDIIEKTKKKGLGKEAARFYGAEIILAIEDLHNNNIEIGEYNPANIFIDSTGHIKLTDIGISYTISKYLDKEKKKEYLQKFENALPPEFVIKKNKTLYQKGYGDSWTLGVILYYIRYGCFPISYERLENNLGNNEEIKINKDIKYTRGKFLDLITRLLKETTIDRLGYNEVEDIKKHPFFEKIDWKKMKEKRVEVPIEVKKIISSKNYKK